MYLNGKVKSFKVVISFLGFDTLVITPTLSEWISWIFLTSYGVCCPKVIHMKVETPEALRRLFQCVLELF